jgi:hypothetical protein
LADYTECHVFVTINVSLFKKLRDIIFWWDNNFMSHFEGHFEGNHSFDPFGSCPLVCIPHVLSYSLNFCSLWFLFPYVLWSPVHSGPVACIPRRFFFPFVCLSLILCVPMLFLFPYITSSLCIVFLLFPLSPCYQIGV